MQLQGNVHIVARGKLGTIIMNPPREPMTKEQTLELAAWLVSLALPEDGEFERVLEEVQNT